MTNTVSSRRRSQDLTGVTIERKKFQFPGKLLNPLRQCIGYLVRNPVDVEYGSESNIREHTDNGPRPQSHLRANIQEQGRNGSQRRAGGSVAWRTEKTAVLSKQPSYDKEAEQYDLEEIASTGMEKVREWLRQTHASNVDLSLYSTQSKSDRVARIDQECTIFAEEDPFQHNTPWQRQAFVLNHRSRNGGSRVQSGAGPDDGRGVILHRPSSSSEGGSAPGPSIVSSDEPKPETSIKIAKRPRRTEKKSLSHQGSASVSEPEPYIAPGKRPSGKGPSGKGEVSSGSSIASSNQWYPLSDAESSQGSVSASEPKTPIAIIAQRPRKASLPFTPPNKGETVGISRSRCRESEFIPVGDTRSGVMPEGD